MTAADLHNAGSAIEAAAVMNPGQPVKLDPLQVLACRHLKCRHRILGCVYIVAAVSADQRLVNGFKEERISVYPVNAGYR